MRTTNRIRPVIAAILAVCLLLSTASFALAETTPMKLLLIGGKDDGFNAAIALWNEQHPEAPITVDYYAQDALCEIIESSQSVGSTDYDVLAVDVTLVGEYSAMGYTKSLNEYVGSIIDTSVFQAPALNTCYYGDSLACLPLTAGISLLYYNKTLLDKAGIEMREITPDNRLTFEEMEAISLQVLETVDPTRELGYEGISFSQPNKLYTMQQLPVSLGGAPLVDENDLSSTLQTDAWKNAAAYYQKLIKEGVSKDCLAVTSNSENFIAGKGVFLLGSISLAKNLKKNPDVEFVTTYNPVFAGYGITGAPTGSWTLGVSGNSKHQDIAAEIINFICAGEGHDIYTEKLSAFSAVQKDADALLADPDGDITQKIGAYEASNAAVARPVTCNFSIYETVVNEFWRNIASLADIDYCIQTAVDTYSIYLQ